MKTLEFDAALSTEGTLPVPAEIARQLEAHDSVHVIVVLNDDDEEAAWKRVAAEQFFKGYADSDAIYDNL